MTDMTAKEALQEVYQILEFEYDERIGAYRKKQGDLQRLEIESDTIEQCIWLIERKMAEIGR